jgi:hypothetical protein
MTKRTAIGINADWYEVVVLAYCLLTMPWLIDPSGQAPRPAGDAGRPGYDIQWGGTQVQPDGMRDHQPGIHRLPWPAAGTYWPLAQV